MSLHDYGRFSLYKVTSRLQLGSGPSIKPGTWNIPEYRIIMRKICKIKFLKVKTNKNKLVSARKTKTKQKYDKKGKKKEN